MTPEAEIELPADVHLVRTTPEFDHESIPAGLLRSHVVAPGVWGRVLVRSGSIDFAFEDSPRRHLEAGDSQVIPPQRVHQLTVTGSVTLVVEFHSP